MGDIVDIKRKGRKIDVSEMDNEIFAEIESKVQDIGKRSADINESLSYKNTPYGLEITIYNQNNHKVFERESAQLTDFAKRILGKISKIIKVSPNLIQITGYTSGPSNNPIGDYGNWELSADRANSVRKFLFIHGVVADKVYEVVARTDTESLDINANALYSTKDARITVTILRNSNVAYQKISVPQDH